MQRWLICTHHLFGWGGSELVAIELVEELRARGCQVDLYSPFAYRTFIREALGDIAILASPAEVNLGVYDVVYSQHQTLSRILAQHLDHASSDGPWPRFIYNHLSPFEPFEFPGPYVEADVADIILCNSPETEAKIASYGPEFADIKLFPNPAPACFNRREDRKTRSAIERLLLVSNHLPEELRLSMAILKESHGVEAVHVGLGGDHRRIQPGDFLDFDAVATIGKTSQYAFRAGSPVYCYDRFGGPGWLTPENFDAAAATNFSGRSWQEKRQPDAIAREIVEGFGEAQSHAGSFAQSRFCLEDQVDALFDAIAAKANSERPVARAIQRHGWDELSRRWRHEAELYLLVDQQFEAYYPLTVQIRAGL